MKILGSFAFLLFTGLVHAQFATTNLLLNPGAETGSLTNWIPGGTSNPFAGNPANSLGDGFATHSGNYYFVAGTGLSGSLSQTVALDGNQSITTSQIDAGHLYADVSFWEQGLNQGTVSDNANVTLTYLDALTNVISAASTPVIDSHDGAWENGGGQFAIPVGTRFIQYTMNFYREVGSDLDAFVDDNSLIVIDTTLMRPVLHIATVGTNAILTWPTNAAGFALYVTTNFPTSWNPVTNLPAMVGTNLVVTNGISGNQFFRLQSP